MASNLLMPIDQQLEDEWQHEHDVWQADNPDAKRGGPRQPQINIGADHTRPALIHAMSLRQEGVLILASEADALTASLAKENGGYSAELRAAYHCEGIQQQRMDVERIARIDEPHLAVLMTGTPAQVPRLMSAGVEDGLYSRFLLYSIPGRAEWRNPYVNSTGEVYRDCRLLGTRLITTYKGLDSMTEPIWFDPPAFSSFSDTFGSHFGDMATDSRHGQWIAPVVMRHCLAATRVAMTLTCLRHGVPEDWRNGGIGAGNYIWERTGPLRPDEDDLIAASLIVEVCLQHSIYYGKRYLNDDHEATKRFQGMAVQKQEALYDELPSEFTGADLKEIAGELDIPHSTAQYWRKKWDDDDVIERLGHSNYRKCKL